MNEDQVIELFQSVLHIGNKFAPRLNPFRIFRRSTIQELENLLDNNEFKRFKSFCPALAQGVEDYFTSIDYTEKR